MTPQDWLKGTKWDGMPYHVTLGHPGWDTTEQQVEVRSCVFSFFVLVGLFLFFWQELAAEISGRRFRITLRKWSQARVFIFCFIFFAPCLRMRVYVCVLCW